MTLWKLHVSKECPEILIYIVAEDGCPLTPKFTSFRKHDEAGLCHSVSLPVSSLPCVGTTLHGALLAPCTGAADGQGLLREIRSPASSASAVRVWASSAGDQGWIRSPLAAHSETRRRMRWVITTCLSSLPLLTAALTTHFYCSGGNCRIPFLQREVGRGM